MGKNSFTSLGESLMSMGGQDTHRSDGGSSNRIIYPAIVRSVTDLAGQNRLKAEIVIIDKDGNIRPGKDKDTPLDKLPICIPLISEFTHIRPQIGECVLIIPENPSDLTSVRYWIGPLISSQLKLSYQSFEDVNDIFKQNTFSSIQGITGNPTKQADSKTGAVLPQETEIAFQGRKDTDLIFSQREIKLITGKFKKGTVEVNVETPCYIQQKQFDDDPEINTGIKIFDKLSKSDFRPFSQQNITSTNINIFSPEGKFRDPEQFKEENKRNPMLKYYGYNAQKLHPVVFGDELIKLVKLMLNYMVNHIHTPQSPPLSNSTSEELEPYINGNKLYDMISDKIRVN